METKKLRKFEAEVNEFASGEFGDRDAFITIVCDGGRTAMAAKGANIVIGTALICEAHKDNDFRLLIESVAAFLRTEHHQG